MESSPASLRCFLKVPLKFQQYWRWIKQKQTDKRPWLPFLGSWEIISVLLQISRCKSSHIWGRYYFSGKQEDRLPVFEKWTREKKGKRIGIFQAWKFCPQSFLPSPHHQKGEVREGTQVGGGVREEGFILEEFQLKTNMTTVLNSQI